MKRLTEVLLLAVAIGAALSPQEAQAGTITSVTAGPGLTGGGTDGAVTLNANFGGDGSDDHICRSDHTHIGQEWFTRDADGLVVQIDNTGGAGSLAALIGSLSCSSAAEDCYGFGVHGSITSGGGEAVYGQALVGPASGPSNGVRGDSSNADGVLGLSFASTGLVSGVEGVGQSVQGYGVHGRNDATSGLAAGVFGETQSRAGAGVVGLNPAGSGNGIGVEGETDSPTGFAGFFHAIGGGTGVRVRVDNPTRTTKFISANNGAYLSSGGTWTNASDVNLKDNFTPLDASNLLRRLQNMPVQEWSYKTEGASVRHVGPTAQDFRAAFALGSDDKSITTVDEAGIALAAIQELDRRTAEMAQLKAQVARLEAAVLALQAAKP